MSTRRNFLKHAAMATAAGAALPAVRDAVAEPSAPASRPNVILYIADEVRADFIGAAQANPDVHTPNLDALAARGTIFTTAVTNQPLCSPSRACMLTSRYATETDVWKLEVDMRQDLPTLATVLHGAGYSTNLIGKWHLAAADVKKKTGFGWVDPAHRGGFQDLWEGANVFERTTHPYYGTIWDSAGNEISWKDEYRTDFITDRAIHFLESPAARQKPFLLYISQLEPHFQNDMHTVVGPKGWSDRYQDPFVPADLQSLPGSWQRELPDYYAAVEAIDATIGRLMKSLEDQKMLDNTIFLFTSDHGCHFQTREDNYKRTPHDSSIRIPLVVAGPGVPQARRVDRVTGNINITPTVLELCGVPVPASMKGRSTVSMMRTFAGEAAWKNSELIQFSQGNGSTIGRAIRNAEWTYSVANPTGGSDEPHADSYAEYVMFHNPSDPAQLVSLCGRAAYAKQTKELRKELLELIEFSGDPVPRIEGAKLWHP